MKAKMVIFVTVWMLVFVPVYTSSLLSAVWNIHADVNVVTLGLIIYEDAAGLVELTRIDWGDIYAGDSADLQIFCKNLRRYPSTPGLSTSSKLKGSICPR